MRTQLVVGPVDEPLYIEEVRMHLRNPEATTNDDELYRMIQTAREMAENKTGRAFLTQTWDVYLDGFPGYYHRNCNTRFSPHYPIQLPYPPLQSVVSVKYLDDSSVLQTFSSGSYAVNLSGAQAYLRLNDDAYWPTPIYGVADPVVIRIKVGWQDAEFVPASIKNWMLLAIEAMDKARGLTQEREPFMTPFADRLLDRYRIVTV